MKRNLLMGFFFAFATLTFLPAGFPQFTSKADCIVMPGNEVKEKFWVDYKEEKIYLCCKSCVKAFKRHPERYLKNLNKE